MLFPYFIFRFYKELNLPAGMEAKMEGRDGGPTFNCIKGWISLKGRDATVQTLLMAANRTGRKGCTVNLEKSLGCQLDFVDSPVDNLTRKVESLSKYDLLKPSFHMSGKSQTIGDFTVSRPSQTFSTNENWKSWTPPIVWDGSRQIRKIGSVSIFTTRSRFKRWSAIIPDIIMKTQICTIGDVSDSFSSLPIL